MLFGDSGAIENRVIVVNRYKVRSEYVDITRGKSVLCNPSSIRDRTRTQAISDFKKHASEQLKARPFTEFRIEMERLLSILLSGGTVRLGCVCKPKDCHGDWIRFLLIAEYDRRSR